MLLSAGEQMSAALGAMTLRSIGVEAVSLCAWQIPIETDGTHGNAEIELIDTARIRKELAEGRVVVAASATALVSEPPRPSVVMSPSSSTP